jgi:hypothetical protein
MGLGDLAWRLYEDPDPATKVYVSSVLAVMAREAKGAQ